VSAHIGTAGFSYKDWEGIVYPPRLKQQKVHPLEYLAQFFDCCEINTSFYGHIRPQVAKDWVRKTSAVNPDFLFTAKLYQGFTHPTRGSPAPSPFQLVVSSEDERLAREGFDAIAGEGKLGAVLVQFPISFRNADDTRDYLFQLLEKFRSYSLVLEVRHESWNDPDVLERLAEHGVGFCNIDQPRLGKSLRGTQHLTSPVGYVRLHGRNYQEWFGSKGRDDRYNYLYKPAELEPWKEKIERISRSSEKTFAITNNHYKGQAAVNALELKSMLSGRKVKAPETLIAAYPAHLQSISEPVTAF
jgi:uncharacterized protein YecE (DUF72 family)